MYDRDGMLVTPDPENKYGVDQGEEERRKYYVSEVIKSVGCWIFLSQDDNTNWDRWHNPAKEGFSDKWCNALGDVVH